MKIKILGVALIILALKFIHIYVSNEDGIYVWDWANYYDKYLILGSKLKTIDSEFINYILNNLNRSEYNISSIILIMPFYLFLGNSRTVYVASIFLVYLLFVIFLLYNMSIKSIVNNAFNKNSKHFLFINTFFYWPLWLSVMRGMPDIVGLIPLGIATDVVINKSKISQNEYIDSLILGFLLWLPFLFRRWYAFSVIILVIFHISTQLYDYYFNRKHFKLSELNKNLLLIGTILSLLAIFQSSFVSIILKNNYLTNFESYKSNFFDQAIFLYEILGPILVVAISLGLIFSIKTKNFFIFKYFLLSFITFIFFCRVQGLGIQHVLPIMFWLFPVAMYSFSYLKKFKLLISFYLMLAFSVVFYPRMNSMINYANWFFPVIKVFPLHFPSYNVYKQMVNDLNSKLSEHDKVSIFAAKSDLTSDIFASLGLLEHIELASQVDSRDGFWIPALRSRFAIVSDPTAVSLTINEQRVVDVPSKAILNAEGFGKSYKLILGPYLLENLKVYIFERESELNEADIEQLYLKLNKFYPSWKLKDDKYIGK